MKRSLLARTVAAVLLAGIAVTGLSACQAAPSAAGREIMTRQLSSDIKPSGVLLAGVILQSGDIEKAVSQGLVTPAEVDEAKKAIDANLMSYWHERAALEQKK
ncbi:MAG: hypothetical protein RIR88_820 [Actinomycetota bacterium]|jgi:hypothetical protein